ncbi:DUF3285 domain-containing protein [Acaryochloris thomasi]|nr:DUF3285 domain-containing protein [Acaryochloris thomasi]
MTSPTESSPETQSSNPSAAEEAAPVAAEPPPSYVKLAMRNMVKKRAQSLFHFGLTATGLLALLIGLSYLTRS